MELWWPAGLQELREKHLAIPLTQSRVIVRPLEENDLAAAGRVARLAFGTFLGLSDPMQCMGDSEFAYARWKTDPSAAFATEVAGELVGSVFVANWGSVGFFGPLTVHPNYWNQGIAQRLLERTMEVFDRWGTKHRGLYTFAHSPKHIALYQKFGFWPRYLTAIMSKEVAAQTPFKGWSRFSEAPEGDRTALLSACREVTGEIYLGLDLEREIRSVADLRLGDTVLLWENARLAGLAVCHTGAGTEAGSGRCYVKFGAVRPGPNAARNFESLVDSCEALATERGATRVVAGMNTARFEACCRMYARGYRTDLQGVVMAIPATAPGYNRPEVYLIDDWR